uniref:Putative secreted protein n=1 Tax=Anopheles triannulatus TaxID=58253 RepID=A0A2M4B4Y9_9DIPT
MHIVPATATAATAAAQAAIGGDGVAGEVSDTTADAAAVGRPNPADGEQAAPVAGRGCCGCIVTAANEATPPPPPSLLAE